MSCLVGRTSMWLHIGPTLVHPPTHVKPETDPVSHGLRRDHSPGLFWGAVTDASRTRESARMCGMCESGRVRNAADPSDPESGEDQHPAGELRRMLSQLLKREVYVQGVEHGAFCIPRKNTTQTKGHQETKLNIGPSKHAASYTSNKES